MSDIAIQVENVSKQYRLGQVGRKSISHDVNRWWHTIRGKEDPYLKIGQENDRTTKGLSEYVWALRDINFSVNQGEVLGIIGRNGAGKSTILKILSKVTAPTTGAVKIRGRIASLLEVGTGFHPDLSGRDNIFLNGAILGMTKKEITSKFDEIVDFAGVERYIDTPVKRYSSGMYVRLAFAVAAHLEPEILVVDEVLAVGDAEFQKKCLGKMKDVSEKDGRTILFVSHNMDAIKRLCNRCLLLEKGSNSFIGETSEALFLYNSTQINRLKKTFSKTIKKGVPFFNDLKIVSQHSHLIYFGDPIQIKIQIFSDLEIQNLECAFQIFDYNDNPIVYNWVSTALELKELIGQTGLFTIVINIPSLRLYKGEYYFGFHLSDPRGKTIFDKVSEFYSFEVNMGNKINEWGWRSDVCKYIEQIDVEVKKEI